MNHFRIALIFLAGCILLGGCSDTIETRFDTHREAMQRGAFERGWLPPDLPKSARNIVERNHLDLNVGTGSFDFDPADAEDYLDHLKETFEAEIAGVDSGHHVALSRGKTSWFIHLPHSGRSATYRVGFQ